MQSGISASEELQKAFAAFISPSTTPPPRALLASISPSPERLIPLQTLESQHSTFSEDLSVIQPHLAEDKALYILIREDDDLSARSGAQSGKCVAITYVPDKAGVRSKMLFASSRLTLVRELGTEHISTTLFTTLSSELTPTGWAEHLAHGSLSAPLTSEERSLEGIREAEAQESTGTSARRGGHVVQGGVAMPIADEAIDALKMLAEGEGPGVVQLAIERARETIVLVEYSNTAVPPGELYRRISAEQPRYTFYRPTASSAGVTFIYTCPGTSAVKDRMVHAASVRSVVAMAADKAGVEVVRKLEAGDPEEIEAEELDGDVGIGGGVGARVETDGGASAGSSKAGFARPKRPGRR